MTRVLVTGGVRSGKSRHAEQLLAGYDEVTYVAPGPTAEEDPDPDWAARLAAHRARRPAGWATLETRDLAAALATPGPVLLDCLGTWLTAVLDGPALGAGPGSVPEPGAGLAAPWWEAPSGEALAHVEALLDAAIAGWVAEPTVLVTNEVGLGVVPSHRSGRLFRDLLGTANQRLAATCDEVHLVVAGRVLRL